MKKLIILIPIPYDANTAVPKLATIAVIIKKPTERDDCSKEEGRPNFIIFLIIEMKTAVN